MRKDNTNSRVARVVSVSIVILAIAGCNQNETSSMPQVAAGATSSAAPASTELDPCALVTKAEAEAVLNEHLRDGESGPLSTHGGGSCTYESPDTLSARNVTIRVEPPNFDWNNVKEEKRIEGERMQPKRGFVRPVPGLGKDAYFARHALHILTKKGALTIIVFKDAGDAAAGEDVETKTESAEKMLAQKAVSRM